jgi:TolB protein
MKRIFYLVLCYCSFLFSSCEDQNQNEGGNPNSSEHVVDGKFVIGTVYGIYTINADGSNQVNISPSDTIRSYQNVQWFPQKDKILFNASGYNSQISGIYVMNADGSNLKYLSKGFWDYNSILSPDGTKIVTNITDKGVCIIDLNGTVLSILTTEYGSKASWSPDGKYVIFSTGTYGDYINVFNSEGTEIASVYKNFSFKLFQWSSDSKKILATKGTSEGGDKGDIYLIDYPSLIANNELNDDNLKALTITGEDYDPCFSPDGTKIAFASRRDDNEELYVMDIDGKNQRRVLITSQYEQIPSWSSDGKRVLFYSYGNGCNIYTINIDGTDVQQITNDISEFRAILSYDCDL